MKQRLLQYVIAFAMLILAFSCGNNRVAKNPSLITDEAGFNLPSYTIVGQADNMDRSASAWSEYSWELKLNEPLSAKSIDELNQLVKKDPNWSYDSSKRIYKYVFVKEDSKNITITISVDTRVINMEYGWWDVLS
ncbi:MAG: hypothetical protein II956_11325 [Bacteroidales bacterium]|nr:hypothetical protein [Bacteroidales bacterium]